MVLCRAFLMARFLYAHFSSLCISVAIGDGAVKVVAVGNCCIYKYVTFVVLSYITMSGPLLQIIRSVIMDMN